jgi:glycosyltransferase involved in cell wall biosynthesis
LSPIDVIVSLRGAPQGALHGLESVLAAATQAAHAVLVVDDPSFAPDDRRRLAELAAQERITLVGPPVARRPGAALDAAAALHPARDVVVVDGDAEVAAGWLDRLVAHARQEGVGAVTTFTNAGGSACYPVAAASNAVPAGYETASLDALFARVNASRAVDLPLLLGPCVYVRRACLDTVGGFAAASAGSDDAPIADLGARAAAAGFHLRLAGDVFVATRQAASAKSHKGAARPDSRSSALPAAARPAPLPHDPARPLRRRVDLERLRRAGRPIIVFVSHGWAGGVRRHMHDLARLADARALVLFLEPAGSDTVQLHWPREDEEFRAYFRLPADLPQLVATLRGIGVARLHFHHVHRLPVAILDLPSQAGLPYDCTLHDHYAICPQYHLVDRNGRYCGEPDVAGCTRCLAARPAQWGMDIAAWREALGALLRGAQRVIAPSRDVAQRIGRYVPGLDVQVWPHPEPPPPPLPRVVRVVILGTLSPEKGLRVAAACAEDARARRLPLAFRVLGATTAPIPQSPNAPLSVAGQYEEPELARLLAGERADVVWFPAQVPETYTYTLSVALAAGLPIVASALGALPERLAQHPRASLVPFDAPPVQWNATLLAAASERVADVAPALAPAPALVP